MRYLWLVLLLTGCAHWELPPVTERSVTLASTDWLDEVRQAQQLPTAVQAEALEQRLRQHKAENTADSGLRLALLLALGGDPVRDDARALALLDQMNPADLTLSQVALADLLRQWLRERQRSQEGIRATRKQLAEREARIQELESQLEAVTSIEQSIRQRQKPLQGVEP